jgi:hypothetical protein
MKPALAQLSRVPNVTVISTIEEGPSPHPRVRIGRIEAQLPPLEATDIVYACGSPRLVDALAGLVDSAGVTFYADPFEPAAPDRRVGLFGRLKTLVKARPNLQQSVEGALAWGSGRSEIGEAAGSRNHLAGRTEANVRRAMRGGERIFAKA